MPSGGRSRNLLAAGVAFAALFLSLLSGGTAVSALLALMGGFAAAWLLFGLVGDVERYEPPVEPTGLPPLPGAAELVEAVEEPLLIVRNRRILLANGAAKTMFGTVIEGTDVRLAIRHPAATEILTTEPEGREDVKRIELIGLGEIERRWEMTVTPLGDGTGIVRLSDRSDSHASEKMRTDFVANASHELRTPLATLLGFLETLQDAKAAEDSKARSRFLRIMFDEARRMQQLIEDLISLSRIEAERFTLPRTPVDLISLVEEIRTSCQQLMEERGSALVVRNADRPQLVFGDRGQLLQLLRNLVVNAVKYGRPGTDVVLEFSTPAPESVRLSVIDRGDGIPPEHLPRLTERFYRVDAGRSRAAGGTGLGLAIVKHIVGRHRGTLDIRSTVGIGTRVDVTLPLATHDDQPSS